MTDTEIKFEEWPFSREDWEPSPLTAQWLTGKPEGVQTRLRLIAAHTAVLTQSTPGVELTRLRDFFESMSADFGEL